MGSLTVFSDASDGYVNSADGTYSVAREGTGGKNPNSDPVFVGQSFNGTLYECFEGFLSFDTSSIPDSATITQAVLSIYGKEDSSTTDFTIEVRLHDWGTTLEAGDFIAGSSLGGKTLLATFATSSFTTSGYNAFTESGSALRDNINKTGTTRFLLDSDRHRLNTTPSGTEYVGVWASEQTGTTQDPKLVITYSEAPTAPTVTSPNGAETIDDSHTITWTAATDPDSAQGTLKYHIQYSANNGSSWTDVIAETAAGATSHVWDTSALAETTAGLIRIRAKDPDGNFGPFDQSNATFTILHNDPPLAPTLAQKDNFDATTAAQFTWTHNDPDSDPQSAFQIRYYDDLNVLVHDTGKVAGSVGAHTLAGGTLTNGKTYQWEARTWDSLDVVGPYSARQAFETSAKPTVTITDPAANGAVLSSDSHVVAWSTSDPESQGQSAFQVVTKDDLGGIHDDTGKVLDIDDRAYLVEGLPNSVTGWSFEVTVWDAADIASATAVRTFDVSYTPPTVPLITATDQPSAGRIRIVIDSGDWPVSVSGVVYSGTGTGTITGPTATTGVTDSHDWEAICVTPAANGGTFDVKVDNVVVGQAVVGTQFTHEGLSFTLNDGATDFALNDSFTWSTTAVKTTSNTLLRRKTGESAWTRIATGIAVDGSYDDYAAASGQGYDYKAQAIGDNGTSSDSATATATLVLKGVWLHAPASPATTAHQFLRDGGGRRRSRNQEAELLQYVGRSRPVAEFGESEEESVTVNLKLLDSTTDLSSLRSLYDLRGTLCYRDPRGRRVFGVLLSLPEEDEFRGATTLITVIATDYTEAV